MREEIDILFLRREFEGRYMRKKREETYVNPGIARTLAGNWEPDPTEKEVEEWNKGKSIMRKRVSNISDISRDEIETISKILKIEKENHDCISLGPWIFYKSDNEHVKLDGKWMVFNKDIELLNMFCKETVHKGIVKEAKFSYISQFGVDTLHRKGYY